MYTCKGVFRLIGSSNRTCLSDGTWSGLQPICNCMFQDESILWFNAFVSKYSIADTLSVVCPDLNHPSNGTVSISSNFVGERANYNCKYGYRLSGSFSRVCQLSGTWSGTQPTCISEYHQHIILSLKVIPQQEHVTTVSYTTTVQGMGTSLRLVLLLEAELPTNAKVDSDW